MINGKNGGSKIKGLFAKADSTIQCADDYFLMIW